MAQLWRLSKLMEFDWVWWELKMKKLMVLGLVLKKPDWCQLPPRCQIHLVCQCLPTDYNASAGFYRIVRLGTYLCNKGRYMLFGTQKWYFLLISHDTIRWIASQQRNLFLIISFGHITFILEHDSFSHSFFRGPKHVTSSGCNLSVTWGGNLTMVIFSFCAFSINLTDTCERCPS